MIWTEFPKHQVWMTWLVRCYLPLTVATGLCSSWEDVKRCSLVNYDMNIHLRTEWGERYAGMPQGRMGGEKMEGKKEQLDVTFLYWRISPLPTPPPLPILDHTHIASDDGLNVDGLREFIFAFSCIAGKWENKTLNLSKNTWHSVASWSW